MKGTNELKAGPQKFRSLPVRTIFFWKLGPDAKLQAARHNRGSHDVSADDNDYLKVIADPRLKLEQQTVPVMPCVLCSQSLRRRQPAILQFDASDTWNPHTDARGSDSSHVGHISGKGHVGIFHYGLVHKPIPTPEALQIPKAIAAVDKEWSTLKSLFARDD